jgi:nucleoside-diphosphate-sugar epimerase
VTGGAGFVGSHLCQALLGRGDHVVCLDNFITGNPANVDHLRGEPRFSLLEHDINEPFVPPEPPTSVWHFASPASPPQYLANPIHTLKVGSIGTINTLEIARVSQATFLLASTSEVYGDPEVSPQPESYRGNVSTEGPRSVYDEAKRFAEAATTAYRTAHGLDTRIARIFNTYGPRLAPGDGRAIPNFVTQALRGDPITIYGDGSQTRSFCYVDDLVRGLLRLEESGYPRAVNLGNPVERSILNLAEKVREATGSTSEIVFDELPTDDPKIRCPDITLAQAELDWKPEIALDEGLKLTVEWFRDALS